MTAHEICKKQDEAAGKIVDELHGVSFEARPGIDLRIGGDHGMLSGRAQLAELLTVWIEGGIESYRISGCVDGRTVSQALNRSERDQFIAEAQAQAASGGKVTQLPALPNLD